MGKVSTQNHITYAKPHSWEGLVLVLNPARLVPASVHVSL